MRATGWADEYIAAIKEPDPQLADVLFEGFTQRQALRVLRKAALRAQPSPLKTAVLEITGEFDLGSSH